MGKSFRRDNEFARKKYENFRDKKKVNFKKNKFDKKPDSVIVEPDSKENNYE